ncbi:MAG TPA: hypothetical protein ENF53_04370 [Thermoprotei archaeon]|nr:hypothetical protein [Thermoprotei archaeon]
MMDLSFDFKDKYWQFKDLRFAFRIYTLDNIYSVDPNRASFKVVEEEGVEKAVVRADGFYYAGGQKKIDGSFYAELVDRGGVIEVKADAGFPEDVKAEDRDLMFEEFKVKALAILIKGVSGSEVLDGRFNFMKIDWDRGIIFNYPRSWITYTYGLLTPLLVLKESRDYTFFLSMDHEVRPKRFALKKDLDGEHLVEIIHEEKAYLYKRSITVPTWRIGKCSDPMDVLRMRMKLMEEKWGLKPWDQRDDVPEWMRKVSLVVNMHGKHWTGFVFNTFSRMLEILEWIAERIDGYRVLVYIPSFNGRYYYDYPVYEPDPDLGGPEGFRKLVEGAHELGMHVVPMYSACAAGFRWIDRLGLKEAVVSNKYGWTIVPPNWVDWDADRERDDIWIPVNLGHPKFREMMFNAIRKVTEEYGVDGAFLDITHFYVNDSKYDFYEGLKQLIRDLKKEFGRNFLVFGEYYYDALMPIIPLFHVPFPENYTEFFTKYIRTAYHLSTPSPGRGSSGVHEAGHLKFFVPDPSKEAIPTLCIVEDTIPDHAEEAEKVIEAAKKYAEIRGI